MEFSLVIPTYNRPGELGLVLEQLKLQQFPAHEWEIIVVDDGSPDERTQETLKNYSQQLPLRWLRQENRGASAASNFGISQARGLYILFIDDDVLAPPNLLLLHQEAHKGHLRRLVRGPVINFETWPPPAPPSGRELWKHYSMNYLCTSNASLRRDLLLEAGLFDEQLPRWEDAELGVRLKALGVERSFVTEAYVQHYKPPLSWEELCRTAAKDGSSAALLYLRYPTTRYWLRSGLHLANRARNQLLQSEPLKGVLAVLPGGKQYAKNLELERVYLEAGWQTLKGNRREKV
jgi:glycosyltransferase involved in cell wall biosynthesis